MATVAEVKSTMKSQWGSAAKGWDAWFEWYERAFAPVIDWCCDAAALAPGMRVLDLACGSGQPALAAAARVAPGRVTAIDLAPEMVAVASRRAVERKVSNVEFLEMDAEDLRFPDATFDAVTCSYVLMFCPDPVRAVSEARRVLKPGGRFTCVVWDHPSKSPMLTVAGQAVGQFFPPQPPQPNAPHAFRFAEPGSLDAVLQAAGLRDVGVESVTMTTVLASSDEYWQMFTEMAAGIKAKLATMSPDDLARLRRIVDENVRPYMSDGVLKLNATSFCGKGTK
jgi:ubiquinone/menaquinone biosynthesis C-methylase UbiE